MTVSTLRSAAKASPIEYALVCPNSHEIVLHDGELRCVEGGTYACRDTNRENEPIAWDVKDLVRSGRTRHRQFTDGYRKASRSGVWPDMATREKWMVAFR